MQIFLLLFGADHADVTPDPVIKIKHKETPKISSQTIITVDTITRTQAVKVLQCAYRHTRILTQIHTSIRTHRQAHPRATRSTWVWGQGGGTLQQFTAPTISTMHSNSRLPTYIQPCGDRYIVCIPAHHNNGSYPAAARWIYCPVRYVPHFPPLETPNSSCVQLTAPHTGWGARVLFTIRSCAFEPA